MTSELAGAIAAYGIGVLTGLYLGFKLWRQEYVSVLGQRRFYIRGERRGDF